MIFITCGVVAVAASLVSFIGYSISHNGSALAAGIGFGAAAIFDILYGLSQL